MITVPAAASAGSIARRFVSRKAFGAIKLRASPQMRLGGCAFVAPPRNQSGSKRALLPKLLDRIQFVRGVQRVPSPRLFIFV